MGLFKFLGVLSPAHISFFTWTARARKIGTDQMGNIYYEASAMKGYKRPRRWVIYNGQPEASNVPPEWHGWLHHQTNIVPDEKKRIIPAFMAKTPSTQYDGNNAGL